MKVLTGEDKKKFMTTSSQRLGGWLLRGKTAHYKEVMYDRRYKRSVPWS